MDINYELYKVFFHVASTLSFSEASKLLFISQSAVSQSIKTLERKLDQTLFIRSTKRVQLTPEGEIIAFSTVAAAAAAVFFLRGKRAGRHWRPKILYEIFQACWTREKAERGLVNLSQSFIMALTE